MTVKENEKGSEDSEDSGDGEEPEPEIPKKHGRVVSYLPQPGFRFYNLAMEIYVETLTGTVFELRVSPFETIMSVKAKIQRMEGIPIMQQHLIYQTEELEDDFCLHDYKISDGSTLKLVLAMRGGPINTRRIPMEDSSSFREMTEFMEATHDDLWDHLPENPQVTLLVFREGDHINFFRVVDRGDGTLTPLSENFGGPSGLYGLGMPENSETDEEIDARINENENTKDKMRDLLAKMKNAKKAKVKKSRKSPRPGSTAKRRPPSSARLHLTASPSPRGVGCRDGASAHRSGTTVKLPPVSFSATKADPPSGAYSDEPQLLPEIMKVALEQEEARQMAMTGAKKPLRPEGDRGDSIPPLIDKNAAIVLPNSAGCASASPSVSNPPSSVSLASPTTCSSANSAATPTRSYLDPT